MAFTEVDICNDALTRIGQEPIMSLTDNTPNSRLCSIRYPLAVEALLRMFPWPFATRRAFLARSAETPPFGFTNSFKLPSDCARVNIVDSDGSPYRIEQGNVITNATEVRIQYVSSSTGTAQMDAVFRQAVAIRMASDMVMKTSESAQMKQILQADFERILVEARNICSTENMPHAPLEGSWLARPW